MIFLNLGAVAFEVINYMTAKSLFTETSTVKSFSETETATTLMILIALFGASFTVQLCSAKLPGLAIAFAALPFRYSFYVLAEQNIVKYNPALSLLFGALCLAGAAAIFFRIELNGELRHSWRSMRASVASLICSALALTVMILAERLVPAEQLYLTDSAINVFACTAILEGLTALILCLGGRKRDELCRVRHLVTAAIAVTLPTVLLATRL